MKGKTIRLLFGLIIGILLLSSCYLLWPHSLADLQPGCNSITVLRLGTAEDGLSSVTTKETYSSGSAKFGQIMDILSRHTYHRSFRTLSGANNMEGNHAGYWIFVYLDYGDDRVAFTCGGTGEIAIDNSVWRVGYLGDQASLDLMQEISAVLEK